MSLFTHGDDCIELRGQFRDPARAGLFGALGLNVGNHTEHVASCGLTLGMREYRIFLLHDGLLANGSTFFRCATDEEAVDKADQISNGKDYEIW